MVIDLNGEERENLGKQWGGQPWGPPLKVKSEGNTAKYFSANQLKPRKLKEQDSM